MRRADAQCNVRWPIIEGGHKSEDISNLKKMNKRFTHTNVKTVALDVAATFGNGFYGGTREQRGMRALMTLKPSALRRNSATR